MPIKPNNGNNSNNPKPSTSGRPTSTKKVTIRDGSGNKDNSRLDDLFRRR